MRLGDFKLLARDQGDDPRQLLARFNANATDYPRTRTVHDLFREQAERTPEAVALIHGETEFSYRVLDRASNQLAHLLVERGVKREDRVAVMLEHAFELVVAVLAILKAGAAYAPIDCDSPTERCRNLLEDTGARVLISERRFIRQVNRLQWLCPDLSLLVCADSDDVHGESEGTGGLGGTESEVSGLGHDPLVSDTSAAAAAPVRRMHQLDRRAISACPDSPLEETTSGDGLAYVIYTSGTSGRPKGVMVEHHAVNRLVLNTDYAQLGPNDRCLQTGSLAFDASTFEIWGPLLNGGALCRPPQRAVLDSAELARLIRRHGITTMWLTASLFNQHVESDLGMFAGLERLLVGGERLSPRHINRVRERYPDLQLINGYGPTENTTFTTCYAIREMWQNDIPIGSPIANTQVLILDTTDRAPVAVGVPGEICAGGAGLARGYLGDPALTASRFVPHPFEPGARIYLTGDLGRWRADGTVQYLGRSDDQVKIRGYRVEPGEVEARIANHGGVAQVLVTARELGSSDCQLVAYIVGAKGLDLDHLRQALKASLPDYMVPSHIVQLDALPLTANGKVDRTRLPDPRAVASGTPRAPEPPGTETERQLVAIWEEVLGHAGVGVTDNFFDAGGHSLRVARVVALIHQRLGPVVPLTALFNRPTVRGLAEYILDTARFGEDLIDQAMVHLSGETAGRTLFAFPPGTGDAAGYILLAERLKPYSFRSFNFIERPTRLTDYADLVTSVDDTGPYVLLGYSSGGNLAYHVTREIERRGRKVSAIVMIDAARKYREISYSDREVRQITDQFLGHPSNQPYLTSVVLRDKAARLVRHSYAWLGAAVDHHQVSADIHVLLSAGAVDTHRDHDGQVLVSCSGWADVTRGRLHTYQGEGPHNHMLHHPYVDRNAELLRDILDRSRPS